MKFTNLFLFTLIFSLGLSSSLLADEKKVESEQFKKEVVKKEAKNTEKKVEVQKTTKDGLTVFIDPATGELVSREEAIERGIIEIVDSLVFEPEVLEEEIIIENPDGSTTIIHPESALFNNKATIDKEGNISKECVAGHDHK